MYRTGVPQRRNDRTCLAETGSTRLPLTKQQLVERAYGAIAMCASQATGPSLVAAVVDLYSGMVHGCRALPMTERASRLVIGRHSQCDLLLPESPNLSLRHFLVLAHRSSYSSYRVLDLRSATEGFVDENHRRHRALIARGGTFLRIDCAGIFLLPVEGDLPPPKAALLFPSPEYIEEPQPIGLPAGDFEHYGRTMVTPVAGPDWCRATPTGERKAAMLVKTRGRSFEVALDRDDLTRGVLLGNYPRCDTGFLHPNVSRVHALVQLIEGMPHLIDTASTNGTQVAGADVEVAPLVHGARFSLGGCAEVEWRERWS